MLSLSHGADEKLVNVGGHVAGSANFELVAWSQGKVRHNFVRTDGKVNDPSPIERTRLMFLAGMIADLEFSLRATAEATVKENYGVTSAGRAARAGKRLAAAQEKVNHPALAEAPGGIQIGAAKTEQSRAVDQRCDQIAQIGIRFAATNNRQDLAGIDAFIPKPDQWK